MEESLANGAADRLFGPIRVLGSKRGSFELAGGMIQPFGGFQLLYWRHGPQDLSVRRAHPEGR